MNNMDVVEEYKYTNLVVTQPAEWILKIHINSGKMNLLTHLFFQNLASCLQKASIDPKVRCIILCALPTSKTFSAGLDLGLLPSLNNPAIDPARNAYNFMKIANIWQASVSALEKCGKPVIAAIQGLCIGGGIDLITACDIRLCESSAVFSVKEVVVGITADLGTLQRLPKICGNSSWVRTVCLTGMDFNAGVAVAQGLVSGVYDDVTVLHDAAIELAKEIAGKSPVATYGTKKVLNYSRDHCVEDGLDYVAIWNAAMINTMDVSDATTSILRKSKPVFAKL